MSRLSRVFLTGLVAVVPLAVVLWLIVRAESLAAGLLHRVFPDLAYFPGLGTAAVVVLILGAGILMHAWLIRRAFELLEAILGRIPLVKTLYGSVRDLMAFFGGSEQRPHSQVVVVQLGETDLKLVGLLTRESFTDLPAGIGGEGEVAVYLPMSYQIGGYLAVVDRERVRPIDMTMEEAMRFVITAGITGKKP
jgi:uncharacterized membrane protein